MVPSLASRLGLRVQGSSRPSDDCDMNPIPMSGVAARPSSQGRSLNGPNRQFACRRLLIAALVCSISVYPCHGSLNHCVDRSNDMVQALSGSTCMNVARGVRGQSCARHGQFCPVVCGLCETLAPGPPTCDDAEVHERKSDLAAFLRETGVCPDCQAPDIGKYTHNDTSFVAKSPNSMNMRSTSGYTSPDALDPCNFPGVSCNRCGEAVMIDWGRHSVVIPGNLTESLFKLTEVHGIEISHAGGHKYHELPAQGWRKLKKMTTMHFGSCLGGDWPDLTGLDLLLVVRLLYNKFRGGESTTTLLSPEMKVWRVEQEDIYPVAFKFTPVLCNCTQLEVYMLVGAEVSGSVEDCVADVPFDKLRIYAISKANLSASPLLMSPYLRQVDIIGAGLRGTLPAKMCEQKTLQYLDLRENSFEGAVPDLSACSGLYRLALTNNKFSSASGPIGGNGVEMTIDGNQFTSFPVEWWSLGGVSKLFFRNNLITTWPGAGVLDRIHFGPLGNLGCGRPWMADRFDWPDMQEVDISDNPMHGFDARTVLGSFSNLPSLRALRVNSCGLAREIPTDSVTGDMLMNLDLRVCGTGSQAAGFKVLSVMEVRYNAIEGLMGKPWGSLQQVDFRGNSIAFVHGTWFLPGAPRFQDFSSNPSLRLDFTMPDGDCTDQSALQADPIGFNPNSGVGYECTSSCSAAGFLLRIDYIVDTETLCRCKPGFYGTGTNCTPAAVDEWAPGSSVSVFPCPLFSSTDGATMSASADACLCDPGMYRADGECRACSANRFRAAPGAVFEAQCEPCESGRYSSAGGTSCEECPQGSVGRDGAGTGCKECEAGKFLGKYDTSCSDCDAGTYSNQTGSSACTPCPESMNTWVWSEDEGRYKDLRGASSRERCGCDTGFRPTATGCEVCTEGIGCPGGLTDRVLTVLPGYYSGPTLSIMRCWGDEDRCPGGVPGNCCAEGRKAITCALCEDGLVPGDNGTCKSCSDASKAVFPIALITTIILSTVVYFVVDSNNNRGMQSNTSVAAAIAAGLLIGVLQQLGVIFIVDVEWVSPLTDLLSALRIMNFDLEGLQLGCVADLTPKDLFMMKIGMIFLAIIEVTAVHIVVTICLFKRQFSQRMPALIGVIGTVATIFYLSVVSAIVGPLQCQDHPNGKWTSRVYRSVLCWESSEHAQMMIISSVGLLIPLAYLSCVAAAVWMYPRKVREADVSFIKTFAFLLYKFSPQGYWYSFVHVLRSFLMGALPIIPGPEIALLLMQLVMIVSGMITAMHLPWRFMQANWLDLLFSILIMLFLSVAALFIPGGLSKKQRTAVGWWWYCLILVSLASVPVYLFYLLISRRSRKTKRFQFFLCHHKASAGAFSRLLKVTLMESPKMTRQVFIDADDLRNLDLLFDHVKDETENLVVMASRDILSRPWCLGEITTAHLWNLRVLPVRMPDYVAPSDEFVDDLLLYMDISELLERGITSDMIKDAVLKLASLSPVVAPTPLTMDGMRALSQALFASKPSNVSPQTTIAESPSGKNKSDLAILADQVQLEAVASALVLERMLTLLMLEDQQDDLPFVIGGEMLPSSVTRCLVMCSTGCFEAPVFMSIFSSLATANVVSHPILTQEAFVVPSRSQEEQLRAALPAEEDHEAVMEYMFRMFKEIATTFAAQTASDAVLRSAATAVKARLPLRDRDSRQARTRTPKARSVGGKSTGTLTLSLVRPQSSEGEEEDDNLWAEEV